MALRPLALAMGPGALSLSMKGVVMSSLFDSPAVPTSPPGSAGLITLEYLQSTLADQLDFDEGLAKWVIEVVSNTARLVANQVGWTAETVPPAVRTVVSLAARRLYTNPDRFTRESSGDYAYALDSSVTNADVFTPTEIGTLRRFAPGPRFGGLRTLSVTRGDAYRPDGYVPDGGHIGFPWYAGGDAGTLHFPGGAR